MTVLKQRFLETVPGALLRIATALEGINEKLELLAQRQEEPATVAEPSQAAPDEDDTIDYDELEESVGDMRHGTWPVKRAMIQALYYQQQYVGKGCITGLSFGYSGVIVKQVEEAMINGEIKVIAPAVQDVEVSMWKGGQHVKTVRKQPVGKYQVSLKSALLWLESHGRRMYPTDSPISKCIDRILKTSNEL